MVSFIISYCSYRFRWHLPYCFYRPFIDFRRSLVLRYLNCWEELLQGICNIWQSFCCKSFFYSLNFLFAFFHPWKFLTFCYFILTPSVRSNIGKTFNVYLVWHFARNRFTFKYYVEVNKVTQVWAAKMTYYWLNCRHTSHK